MSDTLYFPGPWSSQMAILGGKGDTKVIWNPANTDEVGNARRTFEDLRKKGFLAWEVDPDSAEKGKQVFSFNPDAAKLILAPPMAGG